MVMNCFDFGVFVTCNSKRNRIPDKFFRIGDIDSLVRYLKANGKEKLIYKVYVLNMEGADFEAPGYKEMTEAVLPLLKNAKIRSYSWRELETRIEEMPQELVEPLVYTEVREDVAV